MAFAALGTDDGGSNRIPAQFTGVVGMKPTFGLVPRTGVIPTWPYLDTHGPLARTVADAALLLAVVAGADPSDPLARTDRWDTAPLAALRDDALAGARIGLVEAHVPRGQMTAEALAVWDRAVGDLRAAGAERRGLRAAVTLATFGVPSPPRLAGAATSLVTRSRRPPLLTPLSLFCRAHRQPPPGGATGLPGLPRLL